MITCINLQNFKCFTSLKLPLRPLTLLSGGNASGKTTVLHALALIQQTMREQEWSSNLLLNGRSVRLGTAADVIDQFVGRQTCAIEIYSEDNAWLGWTFSGERDDSLMSIQNTRGNTGNGYAWSTTIEDQYRFLLPPKAAVHHPIVDCLRGLTYLTSERLGPRESYQFVDSQLMPVVGPKGEYAVSVLYSDKEVVSERLRIKETTTGLFRQTEAWMGKFFPGCTLSLDRIALTNLLTLGIRITSKTDFLRTINTGFGLTQILPIIVSVLSADKNDILLIENPEVHLHPAAQSEIGKFLALAASSGVQLVVETHSDHILNGIRRTVKKKVLHHEDVAIHFFQVRGEDSEGSPPQVSSPLVGPDGEIDYWPTGFFDQFDDDMNYFAGWS